MFIAEVPEHEPTGMQLIFGVSDAAGFDPDPVVAVEKPFEPTHWGTQEMTVRDPDGRLWSVQTPNAS